MSNDEESQDGPAMSVNRSAAEKCGDDYLVWWECGLDAFRSGFDIEFCILWGKRKEAWSDGWHHARAVQVVKVMGAA